MKKYRLKKEARQFFDGELGKEIQPIKYWNSKTIPIELLDEVERVWVVLGHENGNSTSLDGWTSQRGGEAHFHFTIKAMDIENSDYNAVKIPELMDEIQKACNKFFKT